MSRKSRAIRDGQTEQTDSTTTTEAAAPAAPATPKLSPAERTALRVASERAAQARGEVVRNAAGRPTARHLSCLCGCGQATHRDDAWFLSGHDARLRKAVILNNLGFSQLPEIVKPFFLLHDPIAGLLLDEDNETLLDVKAGGGGLSEHHEFA